MTGTTPHRRRNEKPIWARVPEGTPVKVLPPGTYIETSSWEKEAMQVLSSPRKPRIRFCDITGQTRRKPGCK